MELMLLLGCHSLVSQIAAGNPVDSTSNLTYRRQESSLNYCYQAICYKGLGCFQPWPFIVFGLFTLYQVCPQPPEFIGTSFTLYYQDNPDQPTDSIEPVRSDARIVLFTHGYQNSINDIRFVRLKDELLKVVDLVVLIDYNRGADPGVYTRITSFFNLHQAAANTQVVGRVTANFINKLIVDKAVRSDNIHLIGFSLGSQVMHFAANYSQSAFGFRVSRLTGLDPPGILIFGPEWRVNPSDASYVDVIHTTRFNAPWDFHRGGSGKVGLEIPLGHADFYPNGGGENDMEQPGCDGIPWCSHAYSLQLFHASIEKCKFDAYNCPAYTQYLLGLCGKTPNQRLGYWSAAYPGRGKYYLTTSVDPFKSC